MRDRSFLSRGDHWPGLSGVRASQRDRLHKDIEVFLGESGLLHALPRDWAARYPHVLRTQRITGQAPAKHTSLSLPFRDRYRYAFLPAAAHDSPLGVVLVPSPIKVYAWAVDLGINEAGRGDTLFASI